MDTFIDEPLCGAGVFLSTKAPWFSFAGAPKLFKICFSHLAASTLFVADSHEIVGPSMGIRESML
jgi:hypothetical protein